jgi:hypothetical protein
MIINTSDALSKLTEELKKEGNLLYPLTFCDGIAPMHRVSVRRLSINPNPDHGEVYHPKQVSVNKFALTKVALIKIDLASGLDWIPQLCHRKDNGSDQFYCVFNACAKIQDMDGTYRTVSAEYTLDYRQGSIALEGLSPNDVKQRRMSIAQRAETAAKNRVRRDAVGLRPVYTVDELKRPFIVLKLVKDIPQKYDDAVAASLIGVDRAIFGSSKEEDFITNELPLPSPQTEEFEPTEVVITKEELVDKVSKLYIEKLGRARPESRKPLSELSEEQLNEVIKFLEDK